MTEGGTPLEELVAEQRAPSFLHAAFCFAGVLLLISLGLFVFQVNLHVLIFLALIWSGLHASGLGYSFAAIRCMMDDGIAKALPAIYIFLLIGMVIDSFSSMPIGKSLLSPSAWTGLAAWSSMIFLGALLTALPVVVTMLFINMGLGMTTRAAPALNIFSIGFPALLLAGFAIMIMSLPSMGARIQWLWLQGLQQVNQLLGIA